MSLLAGCVVGGGPLFGYGPRGGFVGAEVGAGAAVVLPQATLGYQSDQDLVYLRVDETVDVAAMQRPDHEILGGFVPGGRVESAAESASP